MNTALALAVRRLSRQELELLFFAKKIPEDLEFAVAREIDRRNNA